MGYKIVYTIFVFGTQATRITNHTNQYYIPGNQIRSPYLDTLMGQMKTRINEHIPRAVYQE